MRSTQTVPAGPRPIAPGCGRGRDLVFVAVLCDRLDRLHRRVGLPDVVYDLVRAALFGPPPPDDADDA